MLVVAAMLATLLPIQTASPADAELKRDLCAIHALSERPGFSEMGSEADARRAQQLNTQSWRRIPAGSASLDSGCVPSFGIAAIQFSPEHTLAISYGGWQAAPLAGAYGECYYEKVGDSWRTLACFITGVS